MRCTNCSTSIPTLRVRSVVQCHRCRRILRTNYKRVVRLALVVGVVIEVLLWAALWWLWGDGTVVLALVLGGIFALIVYDVAIDRWCAPTN